ncbi:hypothetical protein [Phenylobacterium sp.]|uniref:hypothetical protein n=1 Tax=Phenylobacterium sp. TaxID=1871053 RepID=UPI0035B21DF1
MTLQTVLDAPSGVAAMRLVGALAFAIGATDFIAAQAKARRSAVKWACRLAAGFCLIAMTWFGNGA